MESKRIITLCMVVGGTIGSYLPVMWGASGFSMSSLFMGALGAMIGIWIGFRLTR